MSKKLFKQHDWEGNDTLAINWLEARIANAFWLVRDELDKAIRSILTLQLRITTMEEDVKQLSEGRKRHGTPVPDGRYEGMCGNCGSKVLVVQGGPPELTPATTKPEPPDVLIKKVMEEQGVSVEDLQHRQHIDWGIWPQLRGCHGNRKSSQHPRAHACAYGARIQAGAGEEKDAKTD